MWICKMCETSNPDHLTRCSACGAAKPAGSSSVSGSHNTGTSRTTATTTTTTTTTTRTGSASAAASAPVSKGGSSLGVWVVVLLIAAAIFYFASGGGDPMAMYRKVMLGDKSFISGDTGATTSINALYKCFDYDTRYRYAQSFLVADVDNDSKDEVVIQLSEDASRLVLDVQGGKVYGYIFPYRGMKCVYYDGTFEYSSGADSSGCAYARFNGRSCSTTHVSNNNYGLEMTFHSFTPSYINTFVQ